MRLDLKHRLLLALLTIGLLIIPSNASGAPKTRFNILYTNDVMGEVEPCG